MNQSALFLVSAVLAALSSQATCCETLDNRYFDWTGLDDPGLEVMREALKDIKGRNADEICESIEVVAPFVREGPHEERRIYSTLISFTLPGQLGRDEMHRVLQISLLLRDEPRKWRRFIPFLKEYGRDKFGEISKKVNEYSFYPRSSKQRLAEFDLDRFFAVLMGVQSESLDAKTKFEAAHSFDLAKNQLRAREALEALGQSEFTAGAFVEYLKKLCNEFRHGREKMFNVYAFADALGFEGRNDSDYVLKLKEHNRLCLSLLRTGMQKAIESKINQALEASSSSSKN